MSKKFFIFLLGLATLILVLFIVRFSTTEDTWVCQNGAWIKHGNPSATMPTSVCPGAAADETTTYEAAGSQGATTAIGLANPASVNCVDQGGKPQNEKRPDGGEFGVCYFEDNRQCEEWALLRGDCPVGGRKVTGYVTVAGRYCAITGGEYMVTGESDPEKEIGNCKLPGGEICEAEAYYKGDCPIFDQ